MKKLLLASASLFALGSASALAADLPMKAAHYMPPVPVFSWTGCYIGAHGGAGVMNTRAPSAVSILEPQLAFEGLGGNDIGSTGTGGLAGGQLGCNYQDGNWVIGLEGEGYWSGIKSTNRSSINFDNEEQFATSLTAKNKSDYSIAARAGMTFDRTLVYGKAGWVWGKFNFGGAFTEGFCPECELFSAASSGTLNGLLLGVGIEHALTQNWTVKFEYNYLRYGTKELGVLACEGIGSNSDCLTGTQSYSADKHIFKLGVNYLFGFGGAPVVAKY